MLRRILKRVLPEYLLHQLRRARIHPRLREMGVVPKPARIPVEFFGTEYGGFAVDPRCIDKDSIVYVLGAGLDISFEEELIARCGCHVHVYDPTPRSVEWLNGRYKAGIASHPVGEKLFIHPVGIWSDDKRLRFYAPEQSDHVSYSLTNLQRTDVYIEVDCISVVTAMRQNGHARIDLLKLNVEGAEYAILNAMFESGVRPMLLLVNYDEVHTQGDADAPNRLRQISKRIVGNGYRVVYAELSRVTYALDSADAPELS